MYLGLLGLPVTHCFQFVCMYYFCRLLDDHSYGLVFPTSVVDCKKIVGVCYTSEESRPSTVGGGGGYTQQVPFYMGQNGACSVDLLYISCGRLSL